MSDDLTPPKPTVGDDAHRLAKAAAGMVLPAGGELLEAVIGPPLAKRMDAWRDLMAKRVQELLDREQVTVESLQKDPQFIDAVMYASRAAAYTSSEEKRQALANAICNAGTERAPDADEQLVFLRLIDELTEWHFRILAFFNDPPAWFRHQDREPYNPGFSSSLSDALETAYPELVGRRDLYDQLGVELNARGLLTSSGFHVMMSETGWQSSRTTDRGKSLLAFITRPEPADG